MKKALLLAVLVATLASVWFVPRSGWILVVDKPEKSDVILVLAGDTNDVRYWRGMQLLREGYGQELLLDASADMKLYGESMAQAATRFVARSAGKMAARVRVCPVRGDSTVAETVDATACLQPLHPRRVLLVTSDFHTRRALSIFRKRVPYYNWSIAAAPDPYLFNPPWWQQREWAKTTLLEWQKLIWWKLTGN